jgi:hypothetical protein
MEDRKGNRQGKNKDEGVLEASQNRGESNGSRSRRYNMVFECFHTLPLPEGPISANTSPGTAEPDTSLRMVLI